MHLTKPAAQVLGQEVADAVVGSLGGGRTAAQHCAGAVDENTARTHADDAELVVERVVVRRGGIAAEADLTKLAHQADGGAAVPELAGVGRAGVELDTRFQMEAGRQAAAKLFNATNAQAAGRVGARSDALDRACAAVLHLADGRIGDTEQRDRRGLRESGARHRAACQGQEDWLLHVLLLFSRYRGIWIAPSATQAREAA
mmetsp:Transcript_53116/g.124187  ORF Transcript_53116/g.124187 Transcript_53116/m.124187 type:complete len:201 (-) Transcript_53116:1206-1808(-)